MVVLGLRVGAGKVLDVERRYRDLVRGGGRRRLADEPGRGERGRRGRLDLVVREAVVERSEHRGGQGVADIHVRHRLRGTRCRGDVAQDLVVDDDPLRVRVDVSAKEDPSARRPQPGGPRAGIGQERDLSEAAGRADDGAVVDLKDHPLEALVEVDRVVRRVEGAAGLDVAGAVIVDVLRGWEAATGAEHGRCG